MTLARLPRELLGLAFSFALPWDVARAERASTFFRDYLRSGEADTMWEGTVHRLWSRELSVRGTGMTWRGAARELEREAWPLVCTHGVKACLTAIVKLGLAAPGGPWASTLSLEVVRSCLRHRLDLEARRRIALFVCSSSFAAGPAITAAGDDGLENVGDVLPAPGGGRSEGRDEGRSRPGVGGRNILAVLRGFDGEVRAASNPEDALRRLLLAFPFLPIDAGEGADRVIRALAAQFLDTHPSTREALCRATAKQPNQPKARAEAADEAEAAAAELEAEEAEEEEEAHDDAESAVYILIYAVIMLNTDLHHPAIKTKMARHEFVASTQSTVLGETFGAADLGAIYDSVRAAPLAICAPQRQQTLTNLLDQRAREAATAPPATSPLPGKLSRLVAGALGVVRAPGLLGGALAIAAAAWLLARSFAAARGPLSV